MDMVNINNGKLIKLECVWVLMVNYLSIFKH